MGCAAAGVVASAACSAVDTASCESPTFLYRTNWPCIFPGNVDVPSRDAFKQVGYGFKDAFVTYVRQRQHIKLGARGKNAQAAPDDGSGAVAKVARVGSRCFDVGDAQVRKCGSVSFFGVLCQVGVEHGDACHCGIGWCVLFRFMLRSSFGHFDRGFRAGCAFCGAGFGCFGVGRFFFSSQIKLLDVFR